MCWNKEGYWGKDMKIAVRLDDITPAMDWDKFQAFATLLDEFGIKPLIGVVPDNRDENLNRGAAREDFWEYVKKRQEEGWVVAQHGWQHVYTQSKGGVFPLNDFSEFAGVPYEEQLTMLERGKAILAEHGIVTDLFMAPAHSYDRNTLRALRQTGFRGLTDGFGKGPYQWCGLTFYPISFRLENSLRKEKGITTMVVHTNTVSAQDIEKYRKILKEQEVISYGAYLREKAGKRTAAGHAGEYLLAIVKHWLVKLL